MPPNPKFPRRLYSLANPFAGRDGETKGALVKRHVPRVDLDEHIGRPVKHATQQKRQAK